MKKTVNYLVKVKNLDLPKDVLRYTHPEDGSIYVYSYEVNGKDYNLKIWDIDKQGNDIYRDLKIRKNQVRKIEDYV